MILKFTLVFWCLAFSIPVFCQDLVVANTRMNILYIGIENPISFASKTLSEDKIKLTAQRGQIIKSQGKYYYLSCLNNQQGELTIYARNKQNKVIDSVIFRLLKLPDPKLRIIAKNMQEGAYMGDDILQDFVGVAGYFSEDFEFPVSVIGYTISIMNKDILIKEITIEGQRIPADIKEELSHFDKTFSIKLYRFMVRFGCVQEPRMLTQEFKIK